MPEVLDWQRAADPRAVVRRATDALRAGAVVAFPTETGYHLAASALVPAAAGLLREAKAGTPNAPLPLALRGAAEACDWAPGMGPLGRRLARRFWPGPLTLECGDGVADGLAGRLPDAVRREVCPRGRLRLRSPAHEAVLATLGSLAGPMLLAPAPGDDAHPDAAAATPPRYCAPSATGRRWSSTRPHAGATAGDGRAGRRRVVEGGAAGRGV